MLYLSAHEIAIIIGVFCIITFGPPLAGVVLAWVRRMKGPRKDKP